MFNSSLAQTDFFIALILLVFGALGSLFLGKDDKLANWWGNGFAILASIFGVVSASLVMFFGETFSYKLDSTLPLLSLSIRVDKLSAFFILVSDAFFLSYSLGSGFVLFTTRNERKKSIL